MFTGIVIESGQIRACEPSDGGVDLAGRGARDRGRRPHRRLGGGRRLLSHGRRGTTARCSSSTPSRRRCGGPRSAGLAAGDRVNLEPALRVGDPMGGHWVQGHVDGVGEVVAHRAGGRRAELHVLGAPRDHALRDREGLGVRRGRRAHDHGPRRRRASRSRSSRTRSPVTTLGGLGPGDRVNLEADVLGEIRRKAGISRALCYDRRRPDEQSRRVSRRVSRARRGVAVCADRAGDRGHPRGAHGGGRRLARPRERGRPRDGRASTSRPRRSTSWRPTGAGSSACRSRRSGSRSWASSRWRATTRRRSARRSPSRSRRATASRPASRRPIARTPSRSRSIRRPSPADLVQPGHVFPLRARPGGVLERTGQTEASVDLARLAGLQPAGVICEIMNDDGSMARVPDLVGYCARHGLTMITVADLVAYRHRNEKLVERIASAAMPTRFGEFVAHGYRSMIDGQQHVALVHGRRRRGGRRARARALGVPHGRRLPLAALRLRRAARARDRADRGRGQRRPALPRRRRAAASACSTSCGPTSCRSRGSTPSTPTWRSAAASTRATTASGTRSWPTSGSRRSASSPTTRKKILGLEGYGLVITEQLPIEAEPTARTSATCGRSASGWATRSATRA